MVLGKYTLVLEIVDILVKILDTFNDNFYLQDIGIKEISVSSLNRTDIVRNLLILTFH